MKNKLLLVGILSVLLSFVYDQSVAEWSQSVPKIDQSKLCQVSDDDAAKKCEPGGLIYFAPRFFGNEQLPLSIAAAYCDFNHQIMHTNGGVLCIFTDKRLSLIAG